jgi:hypothetical protein
MADELVGGVMSAAWLVRLLRLNWRFLIGVLIRFDTHEALSCCVE